MPPKPPAKKSLSKKPQAKRPAGKMESGNPKIMTKREQQIKLMEIEGRKGINEHIRPQKINEHIRQQKINEYIRQQKINKKKILK